MENTLKKISMYASVLLLALIASSHPLRAALLSDLIASNGSLTDGGLTASNFSFVRNCSGVGVCAPGDASGVSVTLSGGALSLNGGFAAITPGGFASADFLVSWDILSTYAIDKILLSFNGATTGNASLAEVVETILVAGPLIAGQAQVDAPAGPSSVWLTLAAGPYTEFRVIKDILLIAGNSNGGFASSTISFVDQFYPGGETESPEPATYAMIGVALIGLYFKRR